MSRFLQLWCLVIGVAALCLVSHSAAARTAPEPVAPEAVDGPIERLEPGQYLWAGEIAPEGPVMLIISLTTQRLYVYRNGMPIGVSTISSGRPGFSTPTGKFTILQKHRDHKSNLYDDAPMPYMQRLTWSGVAIHAGNLPGYPASHGCIRLPLEFSKLLFGVTQLGTPVLVTKESRVPEVAPSLEDPDTPAPDQEPEPGRYHWQPDASPSGPVSIVVSGRYRRIIVLRNGIEIGAAPVTIDGPVEKTEAFTLVANIEGQTRWRRLALPEQPATPAQELTLSERSRLQMPAQFRAKLGGILQPGATLLVTRDTLRSSGTGPERAAILAELE